MIRFLLAVIVAGLVAGCALLSDAPPARSGSPTVHADDNTRPLNILFILSDDHRYDAMSFMGHPWLQTPNMDRLAREGAHLKNAVVTTSLCSPSRASILTGLYAHAHGVVDNYTPVRKDLVFFPEYLQKAGYATAFIGKWHMGDTDEQQRGFDHWVSFKGQGTYWADGRGTTRVVPQTSSDGFNVNGRRVPQTGYITDELTDYAIDWLRSRPVASGKPWFMYISHKAVHSDFVAADRHRGRYAGKKMPVPPTLAPGSTRGEPMWVANQRNSRHGVDFAYNLPPGTQPGEFDLDAYYQRYCETLLAVDESIGRLMQLLAARGELDRTLIVYMGDNGFQFGEHGLIDKRTAYEASIRVPLLMRCPRVIPSGMVVPEMVANIDIAPTLLAAAGLDTPAHMHGRSFLPLVQGRKIPWRDDLLYEYYWERNYPQTPTMHALLTPTLKFIRYHGVWDSDELYDLAADPHETHNLIADPARAATTAAMNRRIFQILAETGGESIPLNEDRGEIFPLRRPGGAAQSQFPERFYSPQPR